jgi:hypothetical protein
VIKTKVKKGDVLQKRDGKEVIKIIGIGADVFHVINTDLEVSTFPLSSFELLLQYERVPDHKYLDDVNRKFTLQTKESELPDNYLLF